MAATIHGNADPASQDWLCSLSSCFAEEFELDARNALMQLHLLVLDWDSCEARIRALLALKSLGDGTIKPKDRTDVQEEFAEELALICDKGLLAPHMAEQLTSEQIERLDRLSRSPEALLEAHRRLVGIDLDDIQRGDRSLMPAADDNPTTDTKDPSPLPRLRVTFESVRLEERAADEADHYWVALGAGTAREGSESAQWRAAADRLRGAIAAGERRLRHEAETYVKQKLRNELATIAERFMARSAELFVRKDKTLKAFVTYNVGGRRPQVAIAEKRSIVAHVARTRRGYCSNDVDADPRYLAKFPETRSELAVPILDPSCQTEDSLLAVVNLESAAKGAFTALQIDEARAAAAAMLLDLLVLAHLDECPWHPGVHGGWELSRLAHRVCYQIVEAIDRLDGDDCTSAAIWLVDWEKGVLYKYGSSGFAGDGPENELPMDSRTGRVATQESDAVREMTPADLEFLHRDRAEKMGLKRILSAPIRLPRDAGSRHAVAVLNIYFFADRPEVVKATRAVMTDLTSRLGVIIFQYYFQQRRLAAAYLEQRQSQGSRFGFDTLEDALAEVFCADGCSIFAQHPEGTKLFCVASSGLVPGGSAVADICSAGSYAVRAECPAFYDLAHDHGFTAYVAGHPGAVVRKNDVLSTEERGLPPDFPRQPLQKYREAYPLSDNDHRRLLAGNVAFQAGPAAHRTTLGVFRLIRSSQSPPFTANDQSLLHYLVTLPSGKIAFLDWRAAVPSVADLLGEQKPGVIASVARLLAPVSTIAPARPMINQILQDLRVSFESQGVHHVGLVLFHRHARDPYRWHAYDSQYRKAPPNGGVYRLRTETGTDLTDEPVRARRIVTFEHDSETRAGVPGLVAGIRLPILAWTGQHVEKGILALDFLKPQRWSSEEFRLLVNATQQLTSVLGLRDQVIHPKCFHLTAGEALEQVLSFSCTEVGAQWADLYIQSGTRLEPVQRLESVSFKVPDRWIDPKDNAEAADFGVQVDVSQDACSVPLRIGACDVGVLYCGFAGHDIQNKRQELIRTIPGLWTRLTRDVEKFGEVDFKPREVGKGITLWDHEFRAKSLVVSGASGMSRLVFPHL
jgi:putative methionine-R-sulfoxide reductase with GAF domain